MALKIVTEPAAEPVTTAEAKSHLRVDISTDDTLIGSLITAARQMTEQITRRTLITQTWELTEDDWPGGDTIVIPLPPLQSISSIKYTDDDGVEATFGTANYVVDTMSEPGRVRLTSGASWPSDTLQELNGVTIRFVAGYGTAGSAVPQAMRQAMLMLLGHWYENREAVLLSGAIPKEIPFAVDALLWPYRIFRWV